MNGFAGIIFFIKQISDRIKLSMFYKASNRQGLRPLDPRFKHSGTTEKDLHGNDLWTIYG